MNAGTIIALLLGTAGAGYLLTRGNTPAAAPTRAVTYTSPSGSTMTMQVPNVPTADMTAAIAQRREAMIQMIMRSGLSRAAAEARYSQVMPAVTAALTPAPVSGIGNYYRSA